LQGTKSAVRITMGGATEKSTNKGNWGSNGPWGTKLRVPGDSEK